MSDAPVGTSPEVENATPDRDDAVATADQEDPVATAERRLAGLAAARDAGDGPDIDQLRDAERALLAALGRVRKLKRGSHGR